MSSVYVLEPPTKGKVVVKTTMGPLDIELWPKEAPKAVRNFVQLCMEGYYDRTIFHRVIKSFLVQGGDPTGSGTGGESIYGAPFADEFHSRLRFNHRGLVACANTGEPHSNGSQFFLTLDRCDWLDRKHTIFGKVTGDSIYNLVKLGEVETGKDDRPLYTPPKILSVEILLNPFEDIVPRQKIQVPTKADKEGEKLKKKAVKQLNVLSFGEEVEEEEREAEAEKDKNKIKSIHDVLDDPRFLKEELEKEQFTEEQVEKKKETVLSVRDALSAKKVDQKFDREVDEPNISDSDDNDDDDEARFDARMRSQILKKRREMGDLGAHEKSAPDKPNHKDHQKSPPRNKESDVSDDDRKPKVDKLVIKKKGIGSEARAERLVKADADLALLSQAEQQRQLHKQKKRQLHGREEYTLARLQKFNQKLSKSSASTSNNGNSNENEKEDNSCWQTTKLQFMADPSQKNEMARKDDPNDYVVYDPLLEKGKEKFNKMQARFKRREREWAGRSLT